MTKNTLKRLLFYTTSVIICTVIFHIIQERKAERALLMSEQESITQTEIGGGIVLNPGQSYTFIDWKKKLNKECVKKEGHTCTIVNDSNKTSTQEKWYVKIGVAIIQAIATIL